MFGEDASESPRMPSPWLALSPSHSPSPHAHAKTSPSPSPEPLDLNAALGALGDKLSQSLSSSFSSLSLSPALGDEGEVWELGGAGRRRSSGVVGTEGIVMPRLVPEVEEGNIEYKLKLIAPTPDRFARLVTQLKWRLLEGGGQAIYEIGVADSGQLVGLTQGELEESLETLERMADELGATVLVCRVVEVPVLRGRIEGAGRVRGIPSPSVTPPACSAVILPAVDAPVGLGSGMVKRHGKYNHPIGREWESAISHPIPASVQHRAITSSNRKDKKLAVKLRKRETLAGSNANSSRGSGPARTSAGKSQEKIRSSPLSDNAALPEEEDSSGSDSASTASTASATRSASASPVPPPSIPATSSPSAELPLPIRKPRQISQPRGDPLLKAMAKRMKRDAARERGKGLLAPTPLPADEAVNNGLVDSGLAAPAVPLPPVEITSAAPPSNSATSNGTTTKDVVSADLGPCKNCAEEEKDDSAVVEDDEQEQTRWIVEVQVLRKMDADAGEGFLDFEGFGLE